MNFVDSATRWDSVVERMEEQGEKAETGSPGGNEQGRVGCPTLGVPQGKPSPPLTRASYRYVLRPRPASPNVDPSRPLSLPSADSGSGQDAVGQRAATAPPDVCVPVCSDVPLVAPVIRLDRCERDGGCFCLVELRRIYVNCVFWLFLSFDVLVCCPVLSSFVLS